MTINFYLRQRAGSDTGTLQLAAVLPGQGRLRYALGQKIIARYWNAEEQRLTVGRHNPGDGVTNDLLNKYAQDCRELERRAAYEGQPLTIAALRAALDQITGKVTPDPDQLPDGTPTAFYPFARYYFDQQLQRGIITPSSHRTHVSTFSQLEGWRPRLTFAGVTLDFHSELLDWLYGAPKFSSASTAGKYVKTIKTIMRAANERGLTDNQDYRKRGFSKPTATGDHIYLTPHQLSDLYALDLTAVPRLDRVRDQFLVGCWTGLRFSDFTEITPANLTTIRRPDGVAIDGLKITTLKTRKTVTVPLSPVVRAILGKYGGELPRQISNQKFNKYLREVGERAGWTKNHATMENRAGRDVTRQRRLCDLLTSHTARRSFATNMYNQGLPVASIRAITGHTTDMAFYRYIKTDADGHAAIIAASALFAPPGSGKVDQNGREGAKVVAI